MPLPALFYQQIVENSPSAIFAVDARGRVQLWNTACAALLGYAPDAMQGASFTQVLPHALAVRRARRLVRRVFGGARFTDVPLVLQGHDGRRRQVVSRLYPVAGADGRVAACVFANTDVTARRKAERALRRSEARFRLLAEHTTDLVSLSRLDGTVLYVSPSFETQLGHDRAALVGRYVADFLHPDDRQPFTEQVRRQVAEERPTETTRLRMRLNDGTYRWLESTTVLVHDAEGRPVRIICTSHDIAEQQHAEASLRHFARRQEALVEIGRQVLYGRPLPEIAHAALVRLQALVTCQRASLLVYEGDEAVVVAQVQHESLPLALGERLPLEGFWYLPLLRQGKVHRVEDVAAVAHRSALEARALAGGLRSYFTVPLIVRGELLGALNVGYTTSHAFGDEAVSTAEELAFQLGLAVQQVRLEEARQAYEAQLLVAKDQAEEMSRVKSVILANMSHEIRTPLTAIIGFAEVMSQEAEGDLHDFARLIRRSGERLRDTLNSVLDMAQLEGRSVRLHLEAIELESRLAELVRLFAPQAEEQGLALRLAAPPEPVWALADRVALDRVLVNLLSNALKFTNEGGVRVVVEATAEHALVHVEDTGVGVAPDFVPHLFDEFAQESTGLARGYEGNGLGLAISKRLVELMQGTIDVETVKGQGSTFTVRLPRVPQPEVPAGAAPANSA